MLVPSQSCPRPWLRACPRCLSSVISVQKKKKGRAGRGALTELKIPAHQGVRPATPGVTGWVRRAKLASAGAWERAKERAASLVRRAGWACGPRCAYGAQNTSAPRGTSRDARSHRRAETSEAGVGRCVGEGEGTCGGAGEAGGLGVRAAVRSLSPKSQRTKGHVPRRQESHAG